MKTTKLVQVLQFIAANPACTSGQILAGVPANCAKAAKFYLNSFYGYVTFNGTTSYEQTTHLCKWTRLPVYIEKAPAPKETKCKWVYSITQLGLEKIANG